MKITNNNIKYNNLVGEKERQTDRTLDRLAIGPYIEYKRKKIMLEIVKMETMVVVNLFWCYK